MNIKYLIKVLSVLLIFFSVLFFFRVIGFYEEKMEKDFDRKFKQIEKGMSEEEVIRVLGKPDKEGWENGYYFMCYDIPYIIFPKKDFWYEVHLNKKGGKVIRKYFLWSAIQSRPTEGTKQRRPFEPFER